MIHSSYYTYHTNPQDLLRHISAAEGFGVSDDHSVYGLATYHCTSAHGPTCVQRGAVGELEVDEYVDPDLITNDDGAVIIQLGKDVDLGKLLRMFEGGKFDEAMRAARGKGGGGGQRRRERASERENEKEMKENKQWCAGVQCAVVQEYDVCRIVQCAAL